MTTELTNVSSNKALQIAAIPPGTLPIAAVTPERLDMASRLISVARYGRDGIWAYQAFDYINAVFFDNELPTPFILWEMTKWGRCQGLTYSAYPPFIWLHPALFGGNTTETPWGIPAEYLGLRLAYDVLLHECIHMSVDYRLGGVHGESSHNCPEWIAEVNRIAPMIGLDITAARSKSKRVPIEGQFTKTGKPATTVQRVTEGTVPFRAIAGFPDGIRSHLGLMDFYTHQSLPFPHVFDTENTFLQVNGTCNALLEDTTVVNMEYHS